MKKSIILKSFLVILACIMIISVVTSVNAASNDGYDDLIGGGNSASGTNTNTNSNNNTNTNTNTNRNSLNTNTQTTNSLTNRTSNTNLPNTGIQDSLPTVLLVVVFGISAVYAYKKVKDYRNID